MLMEPQTGPVAEEAWDALVLLSERSAAPLQELRLRR